MSKIALAKDWFMLRCVLSAVMVNPLSNDSKVIDSSFNEKLISND
jgi:hypothetical protein